MIASSVEGDSGSKDFLRNLENNRKATADEVKAYENRQHELESAKALVSGDIGVKNYGVIRNGSTIAEVRNDGVGIRGDSDLQLYTLKTDGFSISMDDSNGVTTSAPVVISNPDLVVKSYLGYHSFDTFAYSEAAVLSDAVRTNLSKAGAASFASASDEDEDLIFGEAE